MSNKKFQKFTMVTAGNSDTIESSALPNQEKWFVEKLIACDINYGDNKSSVYVLKWGIEIIGILPVTGCKAELEILEEFMGNGSKKFSVERFNNSGTNKYMPFIVIARKRG
jgi:hypothetical protein